MARRDQGSLGYFVDVTDFLTAPSDGYAFRELIMRIKPKAELLFEAVQFESRGNLETAPRHLRRLLSRTYQYANQLGINTPGPTVRRMINELALTEREHK
ncbi:MAG: hypothetical protein HW405_516 [Candidatus Berkelbacteria bacterium]|nr:hypothetical protein [Candidatus Berkelbacteria bacterium]